MKKLLFIILFSSLAASGFANHLKGGFFTYEYLGPGTSNPANMRYKVTLTVYMSCSASGMQIDANVPFTFFDATTNQMVQNITVSQTNTYLLSKGHDDECITGNQATCYYRIVTYVLQNIELPPTKEGYVIAYQRCCRIGGIANISGNSATIGTTYTTSIPGTSRGIDAPKNSSASFLINDTAVICRNNYFEFPFIATDPDSEDSLTYSFCDAFVGGSSTQGGSAPSQSANPPFMPVPYGSGFSGGSPLGGQVTINPKTGLISGIAPEAGEYVVTVCINEFRKGVLIAQTRKELHIVIGDCNVIKATLNQEYVNCKTSTVNFSNLSPSITIQSHFWDFGVSGVTNDTSNLAAPSFTYPDTGVYVVKLVVNKGQPCSDSTTAIVRVYPGFFPDFSIAGICTNKPTQFTDASTTRYGIVNSWRWDFGDVNTSSDTSRLKNPVYTYTQTGPKSVQFIVGTDKGCRDTVTRTIDILDKPPLQVAFKDTLICNGDTLQLRAIGTGNFTWTPLTRINNPNTANPFVYPNVTTKYFVQLEQSGCLNFDTVQVRVVNFVTLEKPKDTTICLTDSVRLGAITNGLQFRWSPAEDFENPTILNAVAKPKSTTTYTLLARIGNCIAEESVTVFAIPYPKAYAGEDTSICYNTDAFLRGTMTASSFTWTPTNTLKNANTLNPIAHPLDTTSYILTVKDNLGCPKPVSDTVIVNVAPKILAFAGRDTSVVVDQPLQLNATGGVAYAWSPSTGLSNPNIANPVGRYTGNFDSIRYRVYVFDEQGCVDSAFVRVKIFRTPAQIFVPTAFTPNGDGRNDVIRPIAVGITKIEYFRVYNRWGQLVFSTTVNGQGWDGKIKGKEQGTNVFVWVVKASDYTGKDFFAKGTVTLIR